MHVIVDTNVAIVANMKSEQASLMCALACIERLEKLIEMETDTLVIDDLWCILSEYENYLQSSGQPGVGDRFYQWVLRNRENVAHVIRVSITPTDPAKTDFAEFPSNESLAKFNKSDRMFVAVSLMHPDHPPILNAVDTDWAEFKIALQAHGVESESLCPDDLQRMMTTKQTR